MIDSIIILLAILIEGYLLAKLFFPELKEENIFVGFSLMIVILVLALGYLNVVLKIRPSREILFVLLLIISFLIFIIWIFKKGGYSFLKLLFCSIQKS